MVISLIRLFAALAFALGGIAVSSTGADATRPIPGYHYKDMCKNVKGKQPIYQVVGSGPYRVVKPGICVRRGR